jgi:hypothetical protein|tara:strand:+ start:433 stop:693 length:261 start_codon:yes stop_codon:yes gene_type:complete
MVDLQESVYNCYSFKLELDTETIDTHVYVLKSYTKAEAEKDIKSRFHPNKVTKIKKIKDPLDNIVLMREEKKELGSRRKRRNNDNN